MLLCEELATAVSTSLSNLGSFDAAALSMIEWVDNYPDVVGLIKQIGIIPESFQHDSSEEKLFLKVSEAVLARGFRELGLKATVLKERGDSADVQVESKYHKYSLVADAKAFRLSRTAKNQKDFKVAALSGWRKDADYAVLCSPYFQYPLRQSQIYSQSLEHNVCLFSWEHLAFLIQSKVKESEHKDLSVLWSWPEKQAQSTVVSEMKKCFISDFDRFLSGRLHLLEANMRAVFTDRVNEIEERGRYELTYWNKQKSRLLSLSREEAISELIKVRKIDAKIGQITAYIEGLRYE